MKKPYIKNKEGFNLSAALHEPAQATDKIFIFSHSFKGDKEYDTIGKNFCRQICEKGYAALRFDFYGCGNSEGSFKKTTVTSEMADLKEVIKYVRLNGYKRISLCGLSLGAIVSIFNYDKNIERLILWSPAFNLKEQLYEHYADKFEGNDLAFASVRRRRTHEYEEFGREMWMEFGSIDVKPAIKKVHCPVLIIFGQDDPALDEQVASEFIDEFLGETEMQTIKNCDHDYTNVNSEMTAINLTIDWIKKHDLHS